MRNITKSSGAVAAGAVAGLLVLTLTGATNSGAQPHRTPPRPAHDRARPRRLGRRLQLVDGHQEPPAQGIHRRCRSEPAARRQLRRLLPARLPRHRPRTDRAGRTLLRRHGHHQCRHRQLQRRGAGLHRRLPPSARRHGRPTDQRKAGSALDPNTTINIVPIRNADGTVMDADLYVKPALFPNLFAAGVSAQKAAVLAAASVRSPTAPSAKPRPTHRRGRRSRPRTSSAPPTR